MKKISLFLLTSSLFAWDMIGWTAPSTPPSNDNITWCYQNGKFKTNIDYKDYPKLSKIEGGEACWSYKKISTTNDKKDSFEWKEGWNFVTPIFENWDLKNKFLGNIPIAWKWDNNKWYSYNFDYENSFSSLNVGEGMWVYVPKIDMKINTLPMFCKSGYCSDIVTKNKEYKFYLKTDSKNQLKIAFDLYRESNKKHYKFAVGPFSISDLNTKIPVCVEKEGVGGSCNKEDNKKDNFLKYENGYILVDAQQIAKNFNKSIPDTKEKFTITFYIEGFELDNFIDNNFGTLGIDGFGTWVTLDNSKSVKFNMEIK